MNVSYGNKILMKKIVRKDTTFILYKINSTFVVW